MKPIQSAPASTTASIDAESLIPQIFTRTMSTSRPAHTRDVAPACVRSGLAERAEIKSREYFDSRVKLVCRMPKVLAERLNEDGTIVTLQNGSPNAQADEALGHNGHPPSHVTVSPRSH